MKKIVVSCLMLAAMLPLACKEKASAKLNDNVMDTVRITTDTVAEEKSLSRIKGPEGELYVDDGGTGGLPVLFAHSFAGKTTQWKAQLDHLRATRRAIAFDFRGHGQSDSSATNNYKVPSLAQDIAAVVDNLKLERFVLVGHSMGGAVALEYAAQHPDQVAGLVLVGTPGRTPPEQARKIIASVESDAHQQVMDDYMKQMLVNAKPETNLLVMKDMKMIPKETSVSIIRSLFDYDAEPYLKKYTGPKMIVITARENQQGQGIQNYVKDVPIKVVEGTSHWVQMDKPQEFNLFLDEFLGAVR